MASINSSSPKPFTQPNGCLDGIVGIGLSSTKVTYEENKTFFQRANSPGMGAPAGILHCSSVANRGRTSGFDGIGTIDSTGGRGGGGCDGRGGGGGGGGGDGDVEGGGGSEGGGGGGEVGKGGGRGGESGGGGGESSGRCSNSTESFNAGSGLSEQCCCCSISKEPPVDEDFSSFWCPDTSSISSSTSTSSKMQCRLSLDVTVHISNSPKTWVDPVTPNTPSPSLNGLLGKSSSSSSNT
uniref:Uncharacterized protein n=1 Tax=Salix viminalis TaxID=40686 RepID=A0A6N2M119_SALVM